MKKTYSGKFVLRIPEVFHHKLALEASSMKCSLNQLIQSRLSGEFSVHEETIDKIKEVFDPLAIIQFGSSVRGEQTRESDIDILIVLDQGSPIERRLYEQWDQLFSSKTKYSPQFVHLPNLDGFIGGLWLEVGLEGEILFERNALVRQSLVRIKDLIASGHYLRRWTHGQPYWSKIS